jgi:hypothetical protein
MGPTQFFMIESTGRNSVGLTSQPLIPSSNRGLDIQGTERSQPIGQALSLMRKKGNFNPEFLVKEGETMCHLMRG